MLVTVDLNHTDIKDLKITLAGETPDTLEQENQMIKKIILKNAGVGGGIRLLATFSDDGKDEIDVGRLLLICYPDLLR